MFIFTSDCTRFLVKNSNLKTTQFNTADSAATVLHFSQ